MSPASPLFRVIVLVTPPQQCLVFVWCVVTVIPMSCTICVTHALEVVREAHLDPTGIAGDAI